jgi:predicted GNAT family N-acyltransferase
MQLKLIQHNSPAYEQTISLRDEILRKPLGMKYDKADLDAESDSFHLACYEEEEVIGCLVLKPIPESNELKMRQVAVKENQQGKGVGRKLVEFSEEFAKQKGFSKMTLHAREVAVKFYLALDYKIVGEGFEEVGIPHFKMEKLM